MPSYKLLIIYLFILPLAILSKFNSFICFCTFFVIPLRLWSSLDDTWFILSIKLIELISSAPVGLADNLAVPILIVFALTYISFHFLSGEPIENVLSIVGIMLAPTFNILFISSETLGIDIVSFSINLLTLPCSIISAVNVLEPVPPLSIANNPDDT